MRSLPRALSRPPIARALLPLVAASALSVAAAGCASGGAGREEALRNPAAGTQVTTRIDGGATIPTEIRTVSDPVEGVESYLPAGPEQAFTVLPAAYEAVQLPINTVLSDARTLGLRDGRAPRRLGRQPLSHYLECGTDALGSNHADSWAVTLTVLSRVTGSGTTSSTVVTQVAATARPLSVSGSPINCTSTGFLEKAVNDALVVRLRLRQ